MFVKAEKSQSRLRMALIAPSGAGKTYTALKVATELAGPDGRVAFIDSERGSASKYADEFSFDVLNLDSFSPETYTNAIKAAGAAGYSVLVVDSLTHAWSGKDGALEQVDKAAARARTGNSFTAWREVTPMHNALIDAMLSSPCHVIGTLRTKTEYVLEENEKGKKVPRKVGMAPIQRDGMEYEFDVVCDMDIDHKLIVSKTRCKALDRAVIDRPGKELADTLKAWLGTGKAMPAPVVSEPPAPKVLTPREEFTVLLGQWSGIDAAKDKVGFKSAGLSILEKCGIEKAEKLTDEMAATAVVKMKSWMDTNTDFMEIINGH